MYKLISFCTGLVLVSILTNFLIYGNAAAQCPNDPCPQQTQSGQTGENPNMNLRWVSGNPPSEISPGETLDVFATGGLPPYTWNISGDGISLNSNNPTDKANNKISAECPATGSTTISLSDSKKDDQSNFINTISGSIEVNTARFKVDDVKTGYGAISRNSSKLVYIKGGSPPFRWTTSNSGFYFDLKLSKQEIVTGDRSARVYTNGSACGAADIQITDGCGNNIEGSVRCSAGRWVERPPSCPIPGPKNYGNYERYEGKYHVYQRYLENWMTSTSSCKYGKTCQDVNCDTRCSSYTMGCTECITFRPPSHTPVGQFPCAMGDPCGDGTYKTVRCYHTHLFVLHEWVCN